MYLGFGAESGVEPSNLAKILHMFRAIFLLALLAPCNVAASTSLSVTVQNSTKGRIDEAEFTLWDAATAKGTRTISYLADFSLSNLVEGDYLFKVESKDLMPVYGALHLAGNGNCKINVVMLPIQGNADAVGAGAALRDAVGLGPPQDPSKPYKMQRLKLKKKVIPDYPHTAGRDRVKGTVRISTIMLSDGSLDDLVVLSAPDKDLAVAALMAVKQWRYSPRQLDGKPVETSFTVDVNFGH